MKGGGMKASLNGGGASASAAKSGSENSPAYPCPAPGKTGIAAHETGRARRAAAKPEAEAKKETGLTEEKTAKRKLFSKQTKEKGEGRQEPSAPIAGGALKQLAGRPLFVVKIDSLSGDVWIGEEPHLYSKEMELKELHLLSSLKSGEKLKVKPRFHHKGAVAQVFYKPPSAAAAEGAERGEESAKPAAFVRFFQAQKALAPGQAAVFYRGRRLVGGGFIAAKP